MRYASQQDMNTLHEFHGSFQESELTHQYSAKDERVHEEEQLRGAYEDFQERLSHELSRYS